MARKTEITLPRVDDRLRSVGIIMDGNGRWAKKRLLPRSAGHIAGAKIVESVLEDFKAMGVRHITLYAFSTENWKRPKEEVDGLMALLYKYLDEVVAPKILRDGDFSVRFLGDKSVLSEKLRNKCIEIENMLTDAPFVCNIAGMWGIRIVGTFICTQLLGYGLASAWGCMILHNLMLCGMFSAYYLSGKWRRMSQNAQ